MTFDQTDEQSAGAIAKLGIRHLLHYSKDPALALVHRVTSDAGPTDFPGGAVFQKFASEAGLFLQSVARPAASRFDHTLFLTKSPDLSDTTLLACRRPKTRNRHDAGDGVIESERIA